MKQEFKTISQRTKKLLNLEEGYDVDFKRAIKGLHGEDLVAFSNSKEGGSILIGVDEIEDEDGHQETKILGCSVGDKSKQKILSKAQNCIPPIEIKIFTENLNKKPFYRIEIPSGDKKPYCTQRGIYIIRDDGNNKVLSPDKLLSIFLEAEGSQFLKRFKKAAGELENVLYDTSNDVKEVQSFLDDILPQIEEFSLMPDEIVDNIYSTIEKDIEDIISISANNEKRLLALLEHFKIEDPYIKDIKENIKMIIIWDLENKTRYNKNKYLKKKRFPQISWRFFGILL